jgi:hypothetical protein
LRSLNFLSQSTNLKELDISDCPTKGTLKSLSNFSQLETLRINNTNIEEGLEYLPLSCQKLYCNSGYESKSIKIVKELDRSKCSEEDEYENRYYNLNK